jgi:hypothetical protein
MNHDFNIGNHSPKEKEKHNDWWQYLLTNNVITAGFDGEPGDRGEIILRDNIGEGELVCAYASGHGYVGVGLAKSRETYKLLNLDYLEHPHHRDVQWLYYVESLDDAMPASKIGVPHPVPTWQTIDNEKAEKILRAFWQNPKTVIRFK